MAIGTAPMTTMAAIRIPNAEIVTKTGVRKSPRVDR
jgi:hypothetical protein